MHWKGEEPSNPTHLLGTKDPVWMILQMYLAWLHQLLLELAKYPLANKLDRWKMFFSGVVLDRDIVSKPDTLVKVTQTFSHWQICIAKRKQSKKAEA